MFKKIVLGLLSVTMAATIAFTPVSAKTKYKELEIGKITKKEFNIKSNKSDDIGNISPDMLLDVVTPYVARMTARGILNNCGVFNKKEYEDILKKYRNPKKVFDEFNQNDDWENPYDEFSGRIILMMTYRNLSKNEKKGLIASFVPEQFGNDGTLTSIALKDWAQYCIDSAVYDYGEILKLEGIDSNSKEFKNKLKNYRKKISTKKVKKELSLTKKDKKEIISLLKQVTKEVRPN